MRLWSIHPGQIYDMALVGLWRAALLARDIIEGRAKGFRIKPPLYRFINHPDPVRAINTYIYYIWLEGKRRGYKFDEKELRWEYIDLEGKIEVPITDGQLAFEAWNLLKNALSYKPILLAAYKEIECFAPNPVFKVYLGPPDPWERVSLEVLWKTSKYFQFGWLKIPIRICK